MNKEDFNTHLLNGTAYEYHTKRIRSNDIRWFITLIVSIIAVVFMMENREPVVIDNSKDVKEYCDSLQNFVDTSLFVEGFKGR